MEQLPIEELLERAETYVNQTDWFEHRLLRDGTAIPAEILLKRTQCMELLTKEDVRANMQFFYDEPDILMALSMLVYVNRGVGVSENGVYRDKTELELAEEKAAWLNEPTEQTE